MSKLTKAELIEMYVGNAGRSIAPDPQYLRKQLNKLTKTQIIKHGLAIGTLSPSEI
jgi:hypothetical protein